MIAVAFILTLGFCDCVFRVLKIFVIEIKRFCVNFFKEMYFFCCKHLSL